MKGILTEKYKFYEFDEKQFSKTPSHDLNDGFVCKLQLKALPKESEILFSIDGLELSFVEKAADDKDSFTRTELADRIDLHKDEDGVIRLLEMKANFLSPYETEPREMVVDLPIKLFNPVEKEVYFVYDGVGFLWVVDGEIVNRNDPFGMLVRKDERVISEYLTAFGFAPISAVHWEWKKEKRQKNMAFYSPRGYNTWAGDVVNFYKDGVYHLIYFMDRHHHSSRDGAGAHTMWHMTTRDFKTWEEHGPILELDEQWKTVGTGTMFFHGGKYYFSHGWHTTRKVPYEKTGTVLLKERSTDDIVHGASYEELYEKGLFPSGANYCVSEDGIHFELGNYQFHISENPSIYTEEDGKLSMYGGYGGDGVWRSERVEGPWVKESGFAMNASPLKPSTECPSKFELNGYKYLLVGGTGFWQTERGGDEFIDVAKDGYDIYDGMFVPMVTKTEDNRLIYGGWLRGYGWGSFIVHRELLQGENGRLYMRWLPELEPTKDELEDTNSWELEETSSYYLQAEIKPTQTAKVVLRFVGEKDCALYLDTAKQTAQISAIEKDEFYPQEILPLYERVKVEDVPSKPDIYGDFTLGRVDHIDKPYTLRAVLHYEKKLGCAVVDVEIGGKRTLVSIRVDSVFHGVAWHLENAEISSKKLWKVKE